MQITTTIKYIRINPRKLHRVIRELVGKSVPDAKKILKYLPQHSAAVLVKVLASATANAVNNFKMTEQNLVVSAGYVGQAAVMKRFTPMSRGRAGAIQKKLSHITISLKEGSFN